MKDNFTIPINTYVKPKRVSIRKGRWSTDEQVKFNEGLQLFGRNWKKIQSYVRSRSLLQIRSHAQKYFMMQHKIQKRKKNVKNAIIKSQIIASKVQSQNTGVEIIDCINKFEPIEYLTLAGIQNNQISNPKYQYSSMSIVPQAINYLNQNIYPNIQLISNPYSQVLIENSQPPAYVMMSNTLPNNLTAVSNALVGCSPYFISMN